MIDFNYSTQGGEIIITLKIPITEIGTLHKMVAVIYSLDWDINSGDIRTLSDGEIVYSFDTFKIRKEPKKKYATPSELSLLMEAVFSEETNLDEIYKKIDLKKPKPRKFFKSKSELVFQDDLEKNHTIFYIEAENAKGLLFYLTKVLKDYRIDIIEAVIETDPYTMMAKDTFYLRDSMGNLFGDQPIAEEIRKKILKDI